jgi:hypothetical protein
MLAHERGDTFRLTNTGQSTADDVVVIPPDRELPVWTRGGPDLDPGQHLSFVASPRWGQRAVKLDWTDQTGTRRTEYLDLPGHSGG